MSTEWPKELVDLMQWALDESARVSKRIEQRYRVKLDPSEQAQIANAIVQSKEKQMITTSQIQALSNEAGEHGDLEQVRICERALDGDEAAIRECQRVIDHAKAQE